MELSSHNTNKRGRMSLVCYCLLFTASVLILFAPAKKAFSECAENPGEDGIAESSCDCNYWDSMESHAWLAAEREVVQNQNLIAKPDSVLEYSCFENFVGVTAEKIGPIFSENTDVWGSIPGQGPSSLDQPLMESVVDSMYSWVGLNFYHTFLGGRTDDLDWEGNVSGSYDCGVLAVVWHVAKCYNFATRAHDRFFTFEEYIEDEDKRELPDPCEKDARWAEQFDIALLTTPWQPEQQPFDDVTYEATGWFLDPGECLMPQKTGVIIMPVLQGDPGPDAFCTNPGCAYKDGECSF